jgi:coproporphyrinogen III oxidase
MRTPAQSERAFRALKQLEALQHRFVTALEAVGNPSFEAVEWFRDGGRHGGGQRFSAADSPVLGRASVNVSQVHYDDDPARELGSASAFSAIVHPAHPLAPSVHLHFSWTEDKDGRGYWRMMADLNPALQNGLHTERFAAALRKAAPDVWSEAREQGDQYFFIPALGRHRGVVHFYLEQWNSGVFDADAELARRLGETTVDAYTSMLAEVMTSATEPTREQRAEQLAYHTLYFFQVLTLDRGTTAGLRVHDENDIGILGSLPPRLDRNLLASWRSRMPPPQDRLLDQLLAVLPDQGRCMIGDDEKRKLANVVRTHYRKYPEALQLQAAGGFAPSILNPSH